MEGRGAGGRGFRFADPGQEEIFRRLGRLVGPGPALFYRDACRHMAAEDPMDTVTHQVGHCVRELEGAMRDVLRPAVGAGRARDGHEDGRSDEGRSEGGGGHKGDIKATLAGLGVREEDPVRSAWLRYAGGLHRRAHRSALNPPRPLDQEFREFFEGMEGVLEEVLSRFEARFVSSFRLVDELLALESPTPDDALRMKEGVPNTYVAYSRFFEGIPDGRWLRPLKRRGLFERPSAAEADETGAVRYVPWPPSRYLTRVAGLEPDLVKEIILNLPATDNVRVHEDVAAAARKMPPALAARVIQKATPGLDFTSRASELPRELAEVVAHLARGGLGIEAVALARELLVLVPETTAPATESGGGAVLAGAEAVPRFGQPEDYDEVVDACLRPLVGAAGEGAFGMLCDLLEEAIRILQQPYREEGSEGLAYEDGLDVMRRSIEDPAHDDEGRGRVGEGAVSRLVSAVRDAAEWIAAADPEAVVRMVAELEERRNETFDRLALHVLRKHAEAPCAPKLVAARLKRKLSGMTPGLFHEYALLLRERFEDLPPETRREILRAIGAGPPQDELESAREHRASGGPFANADPGDEELEAFVRGYAERWRLRLYAVLGDLLPEAERGEYEQLAAGHPDLVERDPLFYDDRRGGLSVPRRESPKSARDLLAMSVGEVVAFLEGFEPADDWEGPEVRDVAEELQLAVAAAPGRFASGAERFRTLDPSYVRALLWGLEDVLRNKKRTAGGSAVGTGGEGGEGTPSATVRGPSFGWGPVLSLGRWVLDQPRGTSGQRYGGGRDSGWGLSRQWMARLLREALYLESEIPFGLREEVWAVLGGLSEDPEPAPSDEADGEDRPGSSPRHLAINTVRGIAMDAVVVFAMWVRQNVGDASWRGLVDAPEAREILEGRLDPAVEPTRTVRSVYGARFPLLVYLDRDWSEVQLSKIFPNDGSSAGLRDAAWNSYLLDWEPYYDDVFEVLRPQYAAAVGRLDPQKIPETSRDPNGFLAEHLMTLLRRGKVAFGDADGVLETFYERASDRLRRLAAGFLGRQLRALTGPVPAEELGRLEDLWERRLRSASEDRETPAGEELGAFAWFFLSGKFDEAASIERLERALALGADVERDARVVVKSLADAAPRSLGPTIRCLDKIVGEILADGPNSTWRIMAIGSDAVRLLTAARSSGDQETRRIARELSNVLVAHGHGSFESIF